MAVVEHLRRTLLKISWFSIMNSVSKGQTDRDK